MYIPRERGMKKLKRKKRNLYGLCSSAPYNETKLGSDVILMTMMMMMVYRVMVPEPTRVVLHASDIH